jgi:hypothetical protein
LKKKSKESTQAGEVPQVVKHLPIKCKTKKKKRERERKESAKYI